MPNAQFTTEELIQVLRRSSLPTVLVEGRCDMSVYRWLEIWDNACQVDVLPCGGRTNLLKIYERRTEFCHIPCVFVADRDMWIFSNVPTEYGDVVFTNGYSIENDLMAGCKLFQRLFSEEEKAKFAALCDVLSQWFAFEVERFLANESYEVNLHLNVLIPLGTTTIDVNALHPRVFRTPNSRLVSSIRKAFHVKFRGKNLVDLYYRFLGDANRQGTRFRRENIVELAAKGSRSKYAQSLSHSVRARLGMAGARSRP